MLVIPAIDLMGGACVRLTRGDFSSKEVFSDHPVEVARKWEAGFAPRIHVVDLEGSKEGRLCNFPAVKSIIESVSVPVEVGGGIRDEATAEKIISLGGIVVFGTVAVRQPDIVKKVSEKHGSDKVVVALDSREEEVVVEGWLEGTGKNVFEAARGMAELGAGAILFTAVERDGLLEGPDIGQVKKMVDAVPVPVIASGGVSSLQDIVKLKQTGAWAAIVGKALYKEKFSLEAAIEAAR